MKCGCSLRASARSISSRIRSTSAEVNDVADQRPLLHDLLERVADRGVDHQRQLRLHLGPLAVADGVDEQLPQGLAPERLTEHVEDLIAERPALLLELLEQPLEDLALPGVVGDEVPEVADLLLADAVDAPEPLLDPVGVPWQVVVDHQMRPLEVDALAGGVGGDQDQHVLVLGEGLLHLRRSSRGIPPWMATTASVRPSSPRSFPTR